MDFALYAAALLTLAISVVHSYLGERYILMRLFRRENLPKLFGSTEFTIRTLRGAWHLTTVAWIGFAVILIRLAQGPVTSETLGLIIGAVFAVHFLVAFIGTRGRHLSWIVFLAIGVLAIYATHS